MNKNPPKDWEVNEVIKKDLQTMEFMNENLKKVYEILELPRKRAEALEASEALRTAKETAVKKLF